MNKAILNPALPEEGDLPDYPGIALDKVVLVNSDILAVAAQEALMAADVIGFDTESKPTFRKGEVSTGPHLVQLATEAQVYLFPTTHAGGLAVLKRVLESSRVIKAGFGLGNDRSALKSRWNIELANLLDLGELLRGPWHRGTVGAKVAVAHFFGQKFHKSKKTGTSNWASTRLSERQLLYAANDAHAALQIYRAWRQRKTPAGKELPADGVRSPPPGG